VAQRKGLELDLTDAVDFVTSECMIGIAGSIGVTVLVAGTVVTGTALIPAGGVVTTTVGSTVTTGGAVAIQSMGGPEAALGNTGNLLDAGLSSYESLGACR
jgi:hypothetical protein